MFERYVFRLAPESKGAYATWTESDPYVFLRSAKGKLKNAWPIQSLDSLNGGERPDLTTATKAIEIEFGVRVEQIYLAIDFPDDLVLDG